MQKTRCKFLCQSVTDTGYSQEVKLTASYDPDLPEDQGFSQATPTGNASISVTNPAMKGFFVPQKSYYIDITPFEAKAEAETDSTPEQLPRPA